MHYLYSILCFIGMVVFVAGTIMFFLQYSKNDSKDSRNGAGAMLVLAVVCFFAGSYFWGANSSAQSLPVNSPVVQTTTAPTNNTLMSGENGVLKDDGFIGVGEDKTNYDEMFTYISKNNQTALMNMVAEGKVVIAKKGTKITCVDRGLINAKIQVIDSGVRGWVPVEYLAKE